MRLENKSNLFAECPDCPIVNHVKKTIQQFPDTNAQVECRNKPILFRKPKIMMNFTAGDNFFYTKDVSEKCIGLNPNLLKHKP